MLVSTMTPPFLSEGVEGERQVLAHVVDRRRTSLKLRVVM